MYPHERSLVKRLSDKPFALRGVNSDRDREKIKQTIKDVVDRPEDFPRLEDRCAGEVKTQGIDLDGGDRSGGGHLLVEGVE